VSTIVATNRIHAIAAAYPMWKYVKACSYSHTE
jgi:hypothetical protein